MRGIRQISGQKEENVTEFLTISVDKNKTKKCNSLKSHVFLLLDAVPIEISRESAIETRLNADTVILDFMLTNNQE